MDFLHFYIGCGGSGPFGPPFFSPIIGEIRGEERRLGPRATLTCFELGTGLYETFSLSFDLITRFLVG